MKASKARRVKVSLSSASSFMPRLTGSSEPKVNVHCPPPRTSNAIEPWLCTKSMNERATIWGRATSKNRLGSITADRQLLLDLKAVQPSRGVAQRGADAHRPRAGAGHVAG